MAAIDRQRYAGYEPARSDDRKRTAPVISCGIAQRPKGVRFKMAALRTGSACVSAVILVSTHPGAMAFTRMPSLAQSIAKDLVSETIAVLLAP